MKKSGLTLGNTRSLFFASNYYILATRLSRLETKNQASYPKGSSMECIGLVNHTAPSFVM